MGIFKAQGNPTIGKAIDTTKKGAKIAQDIAGTYNKVAEWCGLPVVPSVFLKK
ncbi:MAG: hypothetical protein GXO96_12125 [Nitrospirae bacterium]|nr:hypothetical protein [Candidatus Manganitrophaceae bacterium]